MYPKGQIAARAGSRNLLLECSAVGTQVCVASALSSGQTSTHSTHLRAALGHTRNVASGKVNNTRVGRCTELQNKQSAFYFSPSKPKLA
jgi:hypothetical protein